MASRCRTCGHLVPRPGPTHWPIPTKLAEMAPFMAALLDAAHEYDSLGDDASSAVEFVRWADVDIQAAAGYQYGVRRSKLVGPTR